MTQNETPAFHSWNITFSRDIPEAYGYLVALSKDLERETEPYKIFEIAGEILSNALPNYRKLCPSDQARGPVVPNELEEKCLKIKRDFLEKERFVR